MSKQDDEQMIMLSEEVAGIWESALNLPYFYQVVLSSDPTDNNYVTIKIVFKYNDENELYAIDDTVLKYTDVTLCGEYSMTRERLYTRKSKKFYSVELTYKGGA